MPSFCFTGVQGLQPGGLPWSAPQHPLDALDAIQRQSRWVEAGAEIQIHLPGAAPGPPAAPGGQEKGRDTLLPKRRVGSLPDWLWVMTIHFWCGMFLFLD